MEVTTGVKAMEVAQFVVMAIVEGCTIGLTILAKTAMSNGMSPFVFVIYTNALASLILLPYSSFFHRDRTEKAVIAPTLLLRLFFLGLTGLTLTLYLTFIGLDFRSPILVCAMGHLVPTFSFLLAILLRTIKLDWRSSSTSESNWYLNFSCGGNICRSVQGTCRQHIFGFVLQSTSLSTSIHLLLD
ncbi:WAT1-related protein At1g70260-like [Rhodamnia argentea]|uniref:WAT1-related protein n=1 Tax=Rhodamnia argentea TaxID=178133 RepID=A0ABM3HJF3_9MYRT|nr:WAT1-related protein At1g70260-like [Rhodamnia argentea]